MASELPTGYFGTFKYNRSTPTESYIDSTVNLAQHEQMVVSFQHEPSGKAVFFKAFIIAFNESYSSDWISETVFGRVDPIQHFKQTTRRMALGLKIPASADGEAFENLGRVQMLTQFLYPNYSNSGININATTLSQNPFVRLKVMNLARKTAAGSDGNGAPSGGGSNKSNAARYDEYTSTGDANEGLLGVITSLNISHNLENGDVGVIQKGVNTILPKMIELNLDFTVVHETLLGWDSSGNFATPLFPYGVNLSDNYTTPDGDDSALSAEEIAELEQQKLLADKRYLTAWGEARLDNDLEFLAAYQKKTGEFHDAVIELSRNPSKAASNKVDRLSKWIGRNKANADYLGDTTEGAAARTLEAMRESGAPGEEGHRWSDFI